MKTFIIKVKDADKREELLKLAEQFSSMINAFDKEHGKEIEQLLKEVNIHDIMQHPVSIGEKLMLEYADINF